MALIDEMNNRFGSQNMVRWTNPGDADATSYNPDVLAAALDDVEGDFEDIAGVSYDSTDKRMLRIAVDGIAYYLKNRAVEHGNFSTDWTNFENKLRGLRKRTNANRLVPKKVLANKMGTGQEDKSFADGNKLSALGFPRQNISQRTSTENFPKY